MAGLIVAADIYLCIKNPQDLDRLLINAMLAMSAFATLHTRLLSLASAGFAAIGAYSSASAVSNFNGFEPAKISLV